MSSRVPLDLVLAGPPGRPAALVAEARRRAQREALAGQRTSVRAVTQPARNPGASKFALPEIVSRE
jgi:hypothetical protein